MDINEATAKAIAAERAAAGLTTKELSEQSGVPERTLIRILKAERDIKITQLAQLANVFRVYPHELIETAEKFQQRAQRIEDEAVPQSSESTDDSTVAEVGALVSDEAAKLMETRRLMDKMQFAALEDEHKYDGDGDDPA